MSDRLASQAARPGRPSKYDSTMCEVARKLALLGCTDEELADFFGVTETTVNNWKAAHPEFLESIRAGKEIADAEVARSLYERATGYSRDAVKIMQHRGEPVVVPYVEHHPPDTEAAKFWLMNRQRGRWRARQEVEFKGLLARIDLNQLSDEQVSRIAAGEHPLSVLGGAVPLLQEGAGDAEDADAIVVDDDEDEDE